jgi:endonuclease/exonuclease/phosphatase family metal-dependent hydrolase
LIDSRERVDYNESLCTNQEGEMKTLFLIIAVLLLVVPAAAEDLTVVTINVWSGLDYEGTLKMGVYETPQVREERYQILVAELKRLDPDVVALNEANPLPRYARRLARDLSMDYVYSVGMGGLRIGPVGIPTNFREGDAILAKKGLGLSRIGKKRLSGGGIITNFITIHASESNQVIGATIMVGDKKLYLFNTHTHASPSLNPAYFDTLDELFKEGKLTREGLALAKQSIVDGQKWRADEIVKLMSFISEKVPAGSPVVLMGDFNTEVDSPEMRPVLEKGFIDTFGLKNPGDPGYTWDPATNTNGAYYREIGGKQTPEKIAGNLDDLVPKRIDLILVEGSITEGDVMASRVVLNQAVGGLDPSDHFGLMSVIRIP